MPLAVPICGKSAEKKKIRKTSYCNLYTKKACTRSVRRKFLGINEKLTFTWFHHHFYRWLFTRIIGQRMKTSEGKRAYGDNQIIPNNSLVCVALPHKNCRDMGSLVDGRDNLLMISETRWLHCFHPTWVDRNHSVLTLATLWGLSPHKMPLLQLPASSSRDLQATHMSDKLVTNWGVPMTPLGAVIHQNKSELRKVLT